jgi:hypothetical protein
MQTNVSFMFSFQFQGLFSGAISVVILSKRIAKLSPGNIGERTSTKELSKLKENISDLF